MAFTKNEQFASSDQAAFPGLIPEHVFAKEFAAVGAAPTLKVGCPVARDTVTGKWIAWSHTAGAGSINLIRGFVYPNEIVIDAADSVLGNVMVEGVIDYAAILAAIPAGEVEADLKTDLKTGLATLGLHVQNLAGVGG